VPRCRCDKSATTLENRRASAQLDSTKCFAKMPPSPALSPGSLRSTECPMPDARRQIEKSHCRKQRPPFERIALLLQGGGALGSYQAGAYQALAEAELHPDWIAGISIGAVNAAIIAGNPPEKRVEKLRDFWETVSRPSLGLPLLEGVDVRNEYTHRFVNQFQSLWTLLAGAPGFFTPRVPPPFFSPPGHIEALSFYDVSPLRATLEHLVDFDLINNGSTHLSLGAVNVSTGNFVYFENTNCNICPEHVMASRSLPPGFAAVEIDGEYYWDGGLVSNTPLQWVLDSVPRQDTLTFQIDLWSARGDLPRNLLESETSKGDPLFEPHKGRHGSVQENAKTAPRCGKTAIANP
jgi:NTE family protein